MNTVAVFSRSCRQTFQFRTATSKLATLQISQSVPSQRQHRAFTSSVHNHSSVQTTEDVASTLPPPSIENPFENEASSSQDASHDEIQTQQPTRRINQPRRQMTQNERTKLLVGTVSRAGTMQQCIQITHMSQVYDKFLQKHYTRPHRILVHDPNPAGYLREGDVIEYSAWTKEEKESKIEKKLEAEVKKQQRMIADAEQGSKSQSKKRQGRRFMVVKKRGGNHGVGQEEWTGPRYVFRRVVTPFGIGLEQRSQEIGGVATTTS